MASTVEGEDAVYVETMKRLIAESSRKPMFVYVPRRPERFDEVGTLLENAGFSVLRRSDALPQVLSTAPTTWAKEPTDTPDIFLGDSLGEMYFYLSMADKAVVGGGFTPMGAHNIIEPLALKKPVITGAQTWTIEYPFEEAAKAGVALSVADTSELADALSGDFAPTDDMIEAFFSTHAGGTERLLNALPEALNAARHTGPEAGAS